MAERPYDGDDPCPTKPWWDEPTVPDQAKTPPPSVPKIEWEDDPAAVPAGPRTGGGASSSSLDDTGEADDTAARDDGPTADPGYGNGTANGSARSDDAENVVRSRRDLALRLAAAGWKIFPLMPGTKEPFKGVQWSTIMTIDVATIMGWFAKTPDMITPFVAALSASWWTSTPAAAAWIRWLRWRPSTGCCPQPTA